MGDMPDYQLIRAITKPILDILEGASKDTQIEVATALTGLLSTILLDLGVRPDQVAKQLESSMSLLKRMGLGTAALREALGSPRWDNEEDTRKILKDAGLL